MRKNVNVQNVNGNGYYVGSATNMARLFIFIIVLFTVVLTSMGFYLGIRIGNLEAQISQIQKGK